MKKFILIAVCLLLVALLTLGVCMYAIGENKDISKPYDMGSEITVTPPEDTPEAQKEMEKKFSVYNHVTEENGKKILTLFSEEQAEEQWAKRQNGEQFRLTYDEILFLIGDSARLYETYDEIILTNASEYGVASTEVPDGIVTDHLQRTGLTYHGEREMYYLREQALAELIRYRLFMLDSGMRRVETTHDPNLPKRVSLNGESVPATQATVTLDDVTKTLTVPLSADPMLFEIIYTTNEWHPPVELALWALLPENTFDTGVAYREALVDHVICGASGYAEALEGFEVTSSVLVIRGGRVRLTDQRTGECVRTELSPFSKPFSDSLEMLLEEVKKWRPRWELKASYLKAYQPSGLTSFVPDARLRIWLCLNDGYWGPRNMTGLRDEEEEALWETLGDPEAVISAVSEGEPVGTLSEGIPYYRVDMGNGTSLLIPLSGERDGEALAAAAVVETAGEHDGSDLFLCIPKALADFLRELVTRCENDLIVPGDVYTMLPELPGYFPE